MDAGKKNNLNKGRTIREPMVHSGTINSVGCFERTACIVSIVKQITSPGGMYETNAQAWCTGKTQRNQMEREVGRGIGMGNTCNSMADSCHCMTKPSEIL